MKNFIKKLRKERCWTQAILAEKVEVRRETIVFLEQGKYIPSLELAFKIAKIFWKNIEEIFLFEEKSKEKKDELSSSF